MGLDMDICLDIGTRHRYSVAVLFAFTWVCTAASCGSEKGEPVGVDSIPHDLRDADQDPGQVDAFGDVGLDVDLDVEPADAEEVRETKEEESSSQDLLEQKDPPEEREPLPVNCGDGTISCSAGIMNISATGHISPWGDCREDGYSWPCLSGNCGQYELCEDDYDALTGMLTTPVEWSDASVTIVDEEVGQGQAPLCQYHSCTWTVTSGLGEAILLLKVAPAPAESLSSVKSTPVEGATNLVASVYPKAYVAKIEVNTVPVDIEQLTLWWAPMPATSMEGPLPRPGMGRAAGVEIVYPDGGKSTLIWRLRSDAYSATSDAPVQYALQGTIVSR